MSRWLLILTARVTMSRTRISHLGGTWAEVLRCLLNAFAELISTSPCIIASRSLSKHIQPAPLKHTSPRTPALFKDISDEHWVVFIQALEFPGRPGLAPFQHGVSGEHRERSSGVH